MAADTDVILVSMDDTPRGTEEKMRAHRTGALHRAFSVFLVSGDGRMLLQQRADGKYHSGGLWTNACCSHPRPDVALQESVHDRMRAELGADFPVKEQFSFVYRTVYAPNLIEYEYDHVFLGTASTAAVFHPDPEEIAALRWVEIGQLKEDMVRHPEHYTSWFFTAAEGIFRRLNSSFYERSKS